MSIYGKIVKIISDTQIIINIGEKDGVKEGMVFIIYDEGEEVKDPLTGESLGKLEIRKGKLTVKQTMPKMSLLETGEKLVKKESALSEATKSLKVLLENYQPYRYERVKERININVEHSALIDFLFQRKLVYVGDKVRSVNET